MEFKYVMIQYGHREIPIIFPTILVHEDIFNAMKTLPNFKQKENLKAVSAGTVHIYPKIVCSGESTTLKLKSRGRRDADIMLLYQYQHGVYEEFSVDTIKQLIIKDE